MNETDNRHAFDLRELADVVWAGKKVVIAATMIGSIVIVIVAINLADIFRAEGLLAPNRSDSGFGSSTLLSQLGGVASLGGIKLAASDNDSVAFGLEVLRSRKFLTDFIERRDILVPLMAAEGFDESNQELVIDGDIYDVNERNWVRKVSPPKKPTPTLLEAYQEFVTEVMSVSRSQETGFIKLSVDHVSPVVAKQWVDWLIEDLNATITQRDVAEAEQAIAYLKEQASATSLSELQDVFFSMIAEQTKVVMLASASSEYLLKIIDPAVVAEEKVKPNRPLICVLGALASGLLGVLIVVVLDNRRIGREST